MQNPNTEEEVEERKTRDIQKMLMDELINLKRADKYEPEEKYFDDHVDDKLIRENTKNIEINDIVTEDTYDNPDIVETKEVIKKNVEDELNDYKNIIEENKVPKVNVEPEIVKVEPEIVKVEPEITKPLDEVDKQIIATTEIEKEANDELVKTIQTTKGTGIVEDVQKDDDVTLDNFMDDMTNMLQETNDKEYNLFNDVG